MNGMAVLLAATLSLQVQPASREREYTWRDGDEVHRVYLVEDTGAVMEELEEVARTARSRAERKHGQRWLAAVGAAQTAEEPVFRSPGGSLMTLPGGVLVLLKEGVPDGIAFLAANGVAPGRVEPVAGLERVFLVSTRPGFPSLEVANRLAELEQVEVSIPNWLREEGTN